MSYNKEIDDFAYLMTIEEFVESCDCGGFIDYDGYGYACKDGKSDESIVISPSRRRLIPKDATHIAWYNR